MCLNGNLWLTQPWVNSSLPPVKWVGMGSHRLPGASGTLKMWRDANVEAEWGMDGARLDPSPKSEHGFLGLSALAQKNHQRVAYESPVPIAVPIPKVLWISSFGHWRIPCSDCGSHIWAPVPCVTLVATPFEQHGKDTRDEGSGSDAAARDAALDVDSSSSPNG